MLRRGKNSVLDVAMEQQRASETTSVFPSTPANLDGFPPVAEHVRWVLSDPRIDEYQSTRRWRRRGYARFESLAQELRLAVLVKVQEANELALTLSRSRYRFGRR